MGFVMGLVFVPPGPEALMKVVISPVWFFVNCRTRRLLTETCGP
jgi:hypothetical protein